MRTKLGTNTISVEAPRSVKAGLARFSELTGADELMVLAAIQDQAVRLCSHELIVEVETRLH